MFCLFKAIKQSAAWTKKIKQGQIPMHTDFRQLYMADLNPDYGQIN